MTGTLTVDGTTITAAEFTADLTTLQSDEDRRDGQLGRQALETAQFPTATFVLTQPIELGEVPAEGATVEATATGDLTLHGVTKSVADPARGAPPERRRHDRRLAADPVRRLRDGLAAVDDRAVGRGQRRAGAPAPADARRSLTAPALSRGSQAMALDWSSTRGASGDLSSTPGGPRSRVRRRTIALGRETAWRLAPLGLLLIAAVAYLWNLSVSGYANTYYSAAAQAASQSWSAMFFGAIDAAGFITVDKPPVSLWAMGVSVRVLGLSPFAILLPQALAGIGAVLLLWDVVRRQLGREAALLAGIGFALTPVAVLMFRYNNPDAVLVLLLVGGGVGAGPRARGRRAPVGDARRRPRRVRVPHQVPPGVPRAAGVRADLDRGGAGVPARGGSGCSARRPIAVVAASAWWVVIVDRAAGGGPPVHRRLDEQHGAGPRCSGTTAWVGSSGARRGLPELVAAAAVRGGGGFGGEPGLLRLFNGEWAGQIAWLVPGSGSSGSWPGWSRGGVRQDGPSPGRLPPVGHVGARPRARVLADGRDRPLVLRGGPRPRARGAGAAAGPSSCGARASRSAAASVGLGAMILGTAMRDVAGARADAGLRAGGGSRWAASWRARRRCLLVGTGAGGRRARAPSGPRRARRGAAHDARRSGALLGRDDGPRDHRAATRPRDPPPNAAAGSAVRRRSPATPGGTTSALVEWLVAQPRRRDMARRGQLREPGRPAPARVRRPGHGHGRLHGLRPGAHAVAAAGARSRRAPCATCSSADQAAFGGPAGPGGFFGGDGRGGVAVERSTWVVGGLRAADGRPSTACTTAPEPPPRSESGSHADLRQRAGCSSQSTSCVSQELLP